MLTVLNIGGADYDGDARDGLGTGAGTGTYSPPGWEPPAWPPVGWEPSAGGPPPPPARIFNLEFTWDLEADWSVSFSALRTCNSYPPFVPGVAVSLRTTADDGSGTEVRFVGDLQKPEGMPVAEGYLWNYTCTGLKRRANYVSLTGLDGSGVASFNLDPDDFLFLFATQGQTVGDVLAAILQEGTNASNLAALGVGNYASLTPPTLPPATLADLAALTIVPPTSVRLSGESILNTLEQFVLQWHPKYCLYVEPDGTIRVRSIFGLSPVAVALPVADGAGDPVAWPSITGPDCSTCYTAWQIQGLDIQAAYLSVVDGTLSPAWTGAQEAAWTIADFLQPKGAVDEGGLSAVTSTSCTVHSDHPSAHWVLNFWNGATVGGWIYLENLSAAGIDIFELRQITSCTALTPGGSATVTWSSGQPLSSTGYTRYRIVGINTPEAVVGREFHVREPSTGKLDRDTLVGSSMYPRSPKGMPVANASRVFNAFYPYAFVQWSRTGAWPWDEFPVPVQLEPQLGRIALTQPAVMASCGEAGTTSVLQSHYPTSYQEGLFYDLKVILPYNRGAIEARAPSTGFQGTAYTVFGIQRPFVQHLDSFTWQGDGPALRQLAQEKLDCYKDAVVSGTIDWFELPTAFDPLAPGYALNVSASGSSTPLDGLNLPVRSCTTKWNDPGSGLSITTQMRFSTFKRPFQGDPLYIHPALASNTFGTQDGVFGMPGGSMDVGDFNAMSTGMGRAFAESLAGPSAGGAGGAADVGVMGMGGIGPDAGRGGGGRQADRFLGPQERARSREWQARQDRQRDPAHPQSIMGMDLAAGDKIDVDRPDHPDSIMNMRRPARPGPKIDVSDPAGAPPAPWRQRRPPTDLARRRGDGDAPDPDDVQSGGGG